MCLNFEKLIIFICAKVTLSILRDIGSTTYSDHLFTPPYISQALLLGHRKMHVFITNSDLVANYYMT